MDARKVRRTEDPSRGVPPPGSSRTVFTLSEDETAEVGRSIGRGLRGGELLVLDGDLGLGKTTFVRGLAQGLGVDPDEVTSPTFTLVHEYGGGRLPFFHVDLYRMEIPGDEVATLGVEEILTAGGVVAVEWGDRLPAYLRRGCVHVAFHDVGEGARRIDIAAESTTPSRPRGDA